MDKAVIKLIMNENDVMEVQLAKLYEIAHMHH